MRNLPQPVTVNDLILAAAVEVLDEVVGLLAEIRDRLPEPAGNNPGGPGAPHPDANVEVPAVVDQAEVLEPKPKPDAVAVTEPAPVKPTKPAAKKATPKPVKES